MAETTSIDQLLNTNSEAYTARASLTEGVLDAATSVVTGDRSGELFTPKNQLGKMDFLQLLVTQMQFQDPLEPVDNTEFVAQLAQFSALEGNMNIEKAISNLNESFSQSLEAQGYSAQSITNASAVSLIGKEVRILRTEVEWSVSSAESVPIRINLGNNAEATVEIRDEEGNVIKTISTTEKNSDGSAEVLWDGTTDDGALAESGTYQIYVQGQDADTSLYAFVQDTVEGVRFSGQGPLVKIAGIEMAISNILDVSPSAESSGFGGISAGSAVGLIGKTVRVMDDEISFVNKGKDTTATDREITASIGSLPGATLEIVDSSGNVVYSEWQNARDDGTAVFTWDGRDDESFDFVPSGTYTLRLKGVSDDDNAYIYSEGVVDGVSNLASGAQIRVNGKTVDLASIVDISA